jgi:2-polyprenyl-3-methyl-5-hydroxy-6-metoxy-1,4-benzoquinol methylase
MSKSDKKSWKLHSEATIDQFAASEISLGPWSSYSLIHDPKHISFVLSRYKFCSKLLAGKDSVLEIGCGDGIGIPLMAQSVKQLHCIDWDERNIQGNLRRLSMLKNVTYEYLDITEQKPKDIYDAAISIDVLEHIEPSQEDAFLTNICQTLAQSGVLIIGTPNKNASLYATKRSDIQHINLKTAEELYQLIGKYFSNCFIFSMNDEVVHTGFYPMAHYLFALCVGKK